MGVPSDSGPSKKRQKLSRSAQKLMKAEANKQNVQKSSKCSSTVSCSTDDTVSSTSSSSVNTAATSNSGSPSASSTTACSTSASNTSASNTSSRTDVMETTDSSSGTTVSSDTGSTSASVTTAGTATSYSSVSSKRDNMVPAVASLENLGNTCFMNSVLQVLRFTPRFLENIATLYQDIVASEKIKKRHKTADEEEASTLEEENCEKCWEVVKTIYRVFRDQALLEDRYEEVASDDIMSMAVRPRKVLMAVRRLNPMYEDHHQHDAQEFLRCLQCYIQDAEKEVQKFYTQLPSKLSPKLTMNGVMQKFLDALQHPQEINKEDNLNKNSDNADIKPCIQGRSAVTEVEKVKANLFASEVKSEINTGTRTSPRGTHAADTVSNVDAVSSASSLASASLESTVIGGSSCSMAAKFSSNCDLSKSGRSSPRKVESNNSAKTTQSESSLDNVNTEKVETLKKNMNRASARKGRQFKPYDQFNRNEKGKFSTTRKSKKQSDTVLCGKQSVIPGSKIVDTSSSDQCNRLREKAITVSANEVKDASNSGDLVDMKSLKTYSTKGKKRLGMKGGCCKKTAEDIFDEVKALEQSVQESNGRQNDRNGHKILDENNSSAANKTAYAGNGSSSGVIGDDTRVLNGNSLDRSYNKSSVNIDKDMADISPNSVEGCRSIQRVMSELLSTLVASQESKDDSTATDSSEEDIVALKLRERFLNEQPRRSPRKTPSKMSLSLSHSNTRTMLPKLDLDAQPMAQQPVQPINPVKIQPIKVEPGSHSNLTPVVILENCNYLFDKNATSVSATYASQCLTPVKKQPDFCSDPNSNNYLRRREAFLPDVKDEELLKQALQEMLNSPVKSRSKFDMVERNFQGSMMLRTTCIECESSREREEEFHDISVPVRVETDDSDDEDGTGACKDSTLETNGSALQLSAVRKPSSQEQHPERLAGKLGLMDLIKASTEVEKLNEDNKYFCEVCKSYTEAERSIHYNTLPNILAIHLKRFSAQSNHPASIVKLNDPVDIPMTLPCLNYKCGTACLRPDHRYQLYGVITHSGSSATSGHYLSYVRALPKSHMKRVPLREIMTAANTQLVSQWENSPEKQARDVEKEVQDANNNGEKSDQCTDRKPGLMTRKKAGVVTKLPSRFTDNVIANTKVKAFENIAPKKVKVDHVEALLPTLRYSTEWFECDDETVRVFDVEEFSELLSGESGALLGTPYLLFYHKATMC